MYKKCIKRSLDFILSLCGIIVLSPVLLVLAVLVRVKLGSRFCFIRKGRGRMKKFLPSVNSVP